MSLVIAAMTIAVLATTTSAFAQWRQPRTSGFGLSYAYSGGTNGFRLERAQDRYLIDVGWFDDDDGNIYCLELGFDPTEAFGEYGGVPFMVGLGGYHLGSDVDEIDDSTTVNFWAGVGDFDHTSSGLFFQYRYIFGGVLGGGQGIVGWSF